MPPESDGEVAAAMDAEDAAVFEALARLGAMLGASVVLAGTGAEAERVLELAGHLEGYVSEPIQNLARAADAV